MRLIKVEKKTTSKLEQVEMMLAILCLVSGIKISKTQLTVLSYYVVYGFKDSTDTLILESNIIPKHGSLRNAKTRLLKKEFLTKTEGLYKTYELALGQEYTYDKIITLSVKLNNT